MTAAQLQHTQDTQHAMQLNEMHPFELHRHCLDAMDALILEVDAIQEAFGVAWVSGYKERILRKKEPVKPAKMVFRPLIAVRQMIERQPKAYPPLQKNNRVDPFTEVDSAFRERDLLVREWMLREDARCYESLMAVDVVRRRLNGIERCCRIMGDRAPVNYEPRGTRRREQLVTRLQDDITDNALIGTLLRSQGLEL